VNAERYFTGELFEFLAELRTNNNREWFQQNKDATNSRCATRFFDLLPI